MTQQLKKCFLTFNLTFGLYSFAMTGPARFTILEVTVD